METTFGEVSLTSPSMPTGPKLMISLLRPSWEQKEQDSAPKAPTTLSRHRTRTRMQFAKLCLPVSPSWNETPAPTLRCRYLQMFCSSAFSAMLTAWWMSETFFLRCQYCLSCMAVEGFQENIIYLVHSKFSLTLLNLPLWPVSSVFVSAC